MKYIPKYKPNQLITGSGNTAIITGWTDKFAVESEIKKDPFWENKDSEDDCKKDPKDDYGVIGNLFSPTRGISILLRNLILNPQITNIIILNATEKDDVSGSCRCLYDFFVNGFSEGETENSKQCWVIISEITGYIDFNIPREVLNQLRAKVKFIYCRTLENAILALISAAEADPKPEPWGEPQDFPEDDVVSEKILPGPRYGHRIEAKTIAEGWVKLLYRIRSTGTLRPTGYDGLWQELIDLVCIVTDEPEEFYFPQPNYLPVDAEYIEKYIPQILEDAPYQLGTKYSYAQRLRSWFGRDQIEEVIKKLIAEIDSASAVMNLWDSGSGNEIIVDMTESKMILDLISSNSVTRFGRNPNDSDHQHGGSPCLNHIWVRVVDNELSLTATFRSNDMFSAWPANAMGLRALQRYIRDEINNRADFELELGPLITISQSAHIYDDCFENVDHLIKNQYKKICAVRNFDDPAGSFVISLCENKIHVEHISPGSGEAVDFYSGMTTKALYQRISERNPWMQVEHAMYLGTELQKAEYCRQKRLPFTQDRSITFIANKGKQSKPVNPIEVSSEEDN
nr:MAG: hypothetical protein [uncultured cyanophage]WFD61424.1 MAG: hypothetical protein [uncultured cyanophage]